MTDMKILFFMTSNFDIVIKIEEFIASYPTKALVINKHGLRRNNSINIQPSIDYEVVDSNHRLKVIGVDLA